MSQEYDYFADPRIGRLFDLVLQLAAELHVTGQRVRALEALLARNGLLAGGAVDAFVPDAEERHVLDRQRDELMGGLMRILTESGPAERPLRDQWEGGVTCQSL